MKMLQFSATHAFVNSEADLPSRLTRGKKKIVPASRKSLGKSREQMQKLLLQQK